MAARAKAAALVSRAMRLRFSVCLGGSILLLTFLHFFLCSSYNYPYMSRAFVLDDLYKKVNPQLELSKSKPQCDYSRVLASRKSFSGWEVHTFQNYNDLSLDGLVNGSFAPAHCNPLVSVAVIVSYRSREEQRNIFLPYMHNFLRKQNIHYKIYIVEQEDEKPFNKGLLYNTGAQQAMADGFPCLVLHDVDLLPLDAANLYACLSQPRHMSASLDKFRFLLTYDTLVGGALAIRADQYVQVNGFSHRFEGWGGEDDDFYNKIKDNGLRVLRLEPELTHYTMLEHAPEAPNAARFRVLRENRRRVGLGGLDGLDELRQRARPRLRTYRLFTLVGVRS
ncbi:beta-1,4-galactosyltransferase 6-like [Hyposmocoma kahamanoa]|uniref:beta-1,4-galactosyltransferase 6-like n=1 Tax=Hyposmocoma kahamanoa TaxID=1477025 RepID=UPI000E6D8525|nr:beta-1,4-galactosyltransferase 6-like [Hyposmocoma kahamanoa]